MAPAAPGTRTDAGLGATGPGANICAKDVMGRGADAGARAATVPGAITGAVAGAVAAAAGPSRRGRFAALAAALALSSCAGFSGARGATDGPVGVPEETGAAAGSTAFRGPGGRIDAANCGGIAFAFGGTTVPFTGCGLTATALNPFSASFVMRAMEANGLFGRVMVLFGKGGSVASSKGGASGAPASSRCAKIAWMSILRSSRCHCPFLK